MYRRTCLFLQVFVSPPRGRSKVLHVSWTTQSIAVIKALAAEATGVLWLYETTSLDVETYYF